MIPSLSTYLIQRRFKKMEQALSEAKAAYEQSVIRGDTRAQHERWAILNTAKHACMRMEISLSRSQRKRSRAKRQAGRLVPQ